MDFVQVYHETVIVGMELFDAFSAEHRLMAAAIEMFHSIKMLWAKLLGHSLLIFFIKVKCAGCQLSIFLYNFIKNIYVERKSFRAFEMFD